MLHNNQPERIGQCLAALLSAAFADPRLEAQSMARIVQTAAAFAALSRCELAPAGCEHWSWPSSNANPWLQFCFGRLERIEAWVRLAPAVKDHSRLRISKRALRPEVQSEPQRWVEASLKRLPRRRLEAVGGARAADAARVGAAP